MKVLLVNQLFKLKAGTEQIAIGTYDFLRKKGHDVFFFAVNDTEYYETNYKYAKYFPKHPLNTKEYLKNPIAYYWNFEAANKLGKMIDEIKPDIIHIHSLISPSIVKVCKNKNIPTIMTIHMMPSQCPATTFLYKNKEICSDFKCKKGNYLHCIFNKCGNNSFERSFRKSILSYIIDKMQIYSNITHFICPSEALKQQVLKTNMCDNTKISTINNFLTENELKTVPNYKNKGYFLYIGRLSKEKGVHYLLNAIKDLPKEIKFKIVGTGNQEHFLKEYAIKNNLNNVEFCGFKNREEIKEIYQNCIATILPCNWFEIFGMTNIEAAINGKPTIASDVGGISEIIEDNKTGLLIKPKDVEQIKNAILTYWNNNQLVVIHGKNAYEKAKNKYSIYEYYNKLILIYENSMNI